MENNNGNDEIKISGIEKNRTPLTEKFPALKDKKFLSIIIVIVLLVLSLAGFGIYKYSNNDESSQNTEYIPPHWSDEEGQSSLPKQNVVESAGKGTISTVDNLQDGETKSAPMVGVDAVGDKKGATLAPPEDISSIGWYVNSAPFGAKNKGSSVITSHIDYNGEIGYGSIFTSLKEGDPITVTNSKGKEFHYEVTSEPNNISKSDDNYVKKTMDTINKMKGSNELVLVTCGGEFLGSDSPLGYADNIVVTAKPVK